MLRHAVSTQVRANTLAAWQVEPALNHPRVAQPRWRLPPDSCRNILFIILHLAPLRNPQNSGSALPCGETELLGGARLRHGSGSGMCRGSVVKHAKQGEDYLLR